MPQKRRGMRMLSIFLMALGAFLIFLAPAILPGLLVLGLGVVIELAGITLEHRT